MDSTFWRVSRFITIALGVAAGVWWFVISIVPTFGFASALNIYPEVQLPLGYALTTAALAGWYLLARRTRERQDETRCRRCNHILRGLSEPRCPECGERI